ncbi:septum formation initiator [Amycolatopsis antarctica]|uniref:Septum formation initiator n=1 Tax=Amycolatopsis antarctica TaxID=1854586 RepID=A0A263D4Y2_9PSEU|nr:septum formation initiator family protein [Amycolatopsis antarctica]OZM73554.1 septum formation initiator [Amycolatopsis antarctica]
MAERGRARTRRGGRAPSSSARRPERARRDSAARRDSSRRDGPRRDIARRAARAEGRRARLRRGLSATRASGAARVLGLSNTRRAAVLAIVVCALAFTIAVPLRTYVTQRSEVSVEEQKRERLQDEVAQLEERKAELADPAQVEAEARRRLRYVMPGETPYMVQLPEDKQQAQNPGPAQPPAPQGAWYEQLWENLRK